MGKTEAQEIRVFFTDVPFPLAFIPKVTPKSMTCSISIYDRIKEEPWLTPQFAWKSARR